jgi:hypothetical protein
MRRIPHDYRVGDKVLYCGDSLSTCIEDQYDGPYNKQAATF